MSPTALLLVLISASLHAVWSTSIKGSRDPLSFNLVQAVITAVPAAIVLAWIDLSELPGELWLVLLGTSVSHGLYFFFLSRALTEGELTLVYPIARSTPAFLPLIAVPMLGESVSWPGALGIATVVGGMWLVHLRAAMSWRSFFGPGARFAYATLLTTVAYSLLDKIAMTGLAAEPLGDGIPRALVLYLILSTGGMVCFLPLALSRLDRAQIVHAARSEWRRALAAALLSLVGYCLILEAYRSAPASYVVAVRQTSVIFAMALGILFLGEQPGRARILGAAATVVGVGLISMYP